MNQTEKPTHELTIEENLTQTFAIYTQKFGHYLIIFIIASIITTILTTQVNTTIQIPPPPQLSADPQSQWHWLINNLPTITANILLQFAIQWLIILGIVQGISVKLTSDLIEKNNATLQESLNYTKSKLLPLLTTSIITFILITIGLIAFIIPGIILGIIFSLTIPAFIIEQKGVQTSLAKSRQLVKNRWLETFLLLFILGLIIFLVNLLTSIISLPLGEASPYVSSLLTAIVQPILPIGLTLHYYSMQARTAHSEAQDI
jgi:hypothetical protein